MDSVLVLKKYAKKIDQTLALYLKNRLSKISGRDRLLIEEAKTLSNSVLASGKRLRPLLTIMAYKAFGGRKEKDIFLPALAFELFHNYTLIHDDIYDEDSMRRGEPSFYAAAQNKFRARNSDSKFRTKLFNSRALRFGAVSGVLAGLKLHNMCAELILGANISPARKLEALKLFLKVSFADNIGQEMDLVFEERKTISEKEYLRLASTKSGTLLRASSEWGAILAGTPAADRRKLGLYIEKLGQTFQIKDDILDIGFGRKGREAGSDIRTGKKTLMLIWALKKAKGKKLKFLRDAAGNPNASKKDIEKAIKILRETGSVDYAERAAKKTINEAKILFLSVRPKLKKEGADFFASLPELLWERNK